MSKNLYKSTQRLIIDLKHQNMELRQQRDELLDACKLSLEWLDDVCNPQFRCGEMVTPEGLAVRQQIEQAIANVGGE